MRPILSLALLLLATAALSGCVSYGGGWGSPDSYDGREWAWMGAWMGAMAMVVLLLMALLVVAAVVVVALVLLAVVGRGPAAQVAGALLLVVGLLWAVVALGGGSLGGVLVGVVLAVLGALALMPAPARPQDGRTVVLDEGRR